MYYLLLLLCGMLVWKWIKKSDATDPPDFPGKRPIVGHGLIMLGDSVKMFDAFKKLSIESVQQGGVVKLHFGHRLLYFMIDPEDCWTVLNACNEKHYFYDFAKPLLLNGLIVADVPSWKKHRKLLNPAFSQPVLDGFIDIFNSQAESLIDQFADEIGQPFNHEAYVRMNNLETICATSLGADSEEYGSLQEEYLPLLEEALHIITIRMQKFWFHDDILFNRSPLKKRQDVLITCLNNLSDKVIQKNRSEKNNSTGSGIKSGKFKPFIDLIMELSKDHPSMTDAQIRGEVNTLILAGHDTSASAISFALTLLGSHPQVQEKAFQEVLQVLGDTTKYVDKEHLSKLVYIEAILKETLRLYPSGPLVARQLVEDIKLKNCTLKAGYGCLISLYGIQRHPIWGPDAEEFRPERWFDKDSLPDAKYFAAFGMGRRSCIGRSYAMMSMKITLAYVIRSYIISSNITKMVVKLDAMIRPVKGFHISLKQRQLMGKIL